MNETRLYICILPGDIASGDEKRLLGGLPDFRREKAKKYMRCRDRILSAAAWRLVRYAVRELAGLDVFSFEVYEDELRKPYFAEDTGVHFNLSHCEGAVACAVSRYPCGVDIEALRTADDAVMRRFIPDRYEQLMRITDEVQKNIFYTQAWTEAESIYKSGVAEGGALPAGYSVYNHSKDIYYIALCARTVQTELIEVDIETILS